MNDNSPDKAPAPDLAACRKNATAAEKKRLEKMAREAARNAYKGRAIGGTKRGGAPVTRFQSRGRGR